MYVHRPGSGHGGLWSVEMVGPTVVVADPTVAVATPMVAMVCPVVGGGHGGWLE